ncbi:hypothetical protein BUALT_Bualt13G0111900 [Buddleja alternifolia]|uniref:EF-hand domain-containing protein n=1 Tax=Buddleja alternifolia TaxID=168488 RepID=A0AAV6WKU0_9LAMI|nr:hypothetical protein BUALT_Bualt13G0111900 [Buddleja alternifolia]
MFDRNGDGKISRRELSESLEKLGIYIPEKELIQMIEKIDVNGNVSSARLFGQNGDRLITVEELRSVLAALGLQQGRRLEACKRMIKRVDVDGDGRVNFDEFRQMMKSGGFAALI